MRRRGSASTAAVSMSDPPQRTRRTCHGSVDSTARQLASIGTSRIAAAWASTSLPTSVPVASVKFGDRKRTAPASDVAPRLGVVVVEQVVVRLMDLDRPVFTELRRRGRRRSTPIVRATTSPSERANVNASSAAGAIVPRSCSTSTSTVVTGALQCRPTRRPPPRRRRAPDRGRPYGWPAPAVAATTPAVGRPRSAVGSIVVTATFFDANRPFIVGYRGRLMPSLTPTTAGIGSSNTIRPASVSRSSRRLPPSSDSALAPLTTGRPRARATRMPTWNPPESADSLPNRMRSNGAPGSS